MPTIPAPEVLAYLAGFFDGEGCIHLTERMAYWQYEGHRTNYVGFFGSVRVKQNVREPLELFHKHFGGNIRICGHPGKGGRNWVHFEWEAPWSQTPRFLGAILPFLIVKRREAEAAMEYYASFHRGRRLTEPTRARRRELIGIVKSGKSDGRALA